MVTHGLHGPVTVETVALTRKACMTAGVRPVICVLARGVGGAPTQVLPPSALYCQLKSAFLETSLPTRMLAFAARSTEPDAAPTLTLRTGFSRVGALPMAIAAAVMIVTASSGLASHSVWTYIRSFSSDVTRASRLALRAFARPLVPLRTACCAVSRAWISLSSVGRGGLGDGKRVGLAAIPL